jgi:hypothetical protein
MHRDTTCVITHHCYYEKLSKSYTDIQYILCIIVTTIFFDGTIHVIYRLLNIVFAKLNLHKIEQRDFELRAQLETRVNKRHGTDKKPL